MATRDFRGRPQGYPIPTAHVAFTIHDTNAMPEDTIAVLVAVSVAGVLVFEDWNDVEAPYGFPAVGTFIVPGNFQRVKATGATATLSPATTVICLRLLT